MSTLTLILMLPFTGENIHIIRQKLVCHCSGLSLLLFVLFTHEQWVLCIVILILMLPFTHPNIHLAKTGLLLHLSILFILYSCKYSLFSQYLTSSSCSSYKCKSGEILQAPAGGHVQEARLSCLTTVWMSPDKSGHVRTWGTFRETSEHWTVDMFGNICKSQDVPWHVWTPPDWT